MGELLLYTRAGCCLCEGLEERLRALDPPPRLHAIDVDADPALAARYGLAVPVLAVRERQEGGAASQRELPPVPPRLTGERLRQWLARQGVPDGHPPQPLPT
jgi:hypothetical protein